MGKLRVLIIDDLPLARQVLTAALSTDPEIEVVGTGISPAIPALTSSMSSTISPDRIS